MSVLGTNSRRERNPLVLRNLFGAGFADETRPMRYPRLVLIGPAVAGERPGRKNADRTSGTVPCVAPASFSKEQSWPAGRRRTHNLLEREASKGLCMLPCPSRRVFGFPSSEGARARAVPLLCSDYRLRCGEEWRGSFGVISTTLERFGWGAGTVPPIELFASGVSGARRRLEAGWTGWGKNRPTGRFKFRRGPMHWIAESPGGWRHGRSDAAPHPISAGILIGRAQDDPSRKRPTYDKAFWREDQAMAPRNTALKTASSRRVGAGQAGFLLAFIGRGKFGGGRAINRSGPYGRCVCSRMEHGPYEHRALRELPSTMLGLAGKSCEPALGNLRPLTPFFRWEFTHNGRPSDRDQPVGRPSRY